MQRTWVRNGHWCWVTTTESSCTAEYGVKIEKYRCVTLRLGGAGGRMSQGLRLESNEMAMVHLPGGEKRRSSQYQHDPEH